MSSSTVCLTNTWDRSLRNKLEATIWEHISGQHTIADTALDIFLVARTLFVGELAEPRNTTQLASFTALFDSFDIFRAGMSVLAKNVRTFNRLHVHQGSIATPYPSSAPDNLNVNLTSSSDDFADIEEYAANAGEELDGVLEPLLDEV